MKKKLEKVRSRLLQHSRLTARLMAQGMRKDDASEKAASIVMAEAKG